jgi:predicted nucleotidyltransferase
MRRTRPLDALFPRTRQAILAATLLPPYRSWSLSDLARHLGVRPSSLQRELASLVDAGVLWRMPDAHRAVYQPNPDCPILPELRGLLVKTVGLRDVLSEMLAPFSRRIDCAFVYGSMARAEETSASDIDLMIVGEVGLADLSPALRRAETRLARPINPTIYDRAELARKLGMGSHFLETVLAEDKLWIRGGPDELAKLTGERTNPHAHDEPPGAGGPARRRRSRP